MKKVNVWYDRSDKTTAQSVLAKKIIGRLQRPVLCWNAMVYLTTTCSGNMN